MPSHPLPRGIRHTRVAATCPALAAIAALAVIFPPLAWAHPEIAAQIDHLSRLIAQQAGTRTAAGLHHQRGELHRVHEDWEAALADFKNALAIDPSLEVVRRSRGRLFLDKGEPRRAVAELTEYLERAPGDPDALALRARAHAALHDYPRADVDYAGAFARSELPSAELVLEWAECRLAGDETDHGERLALDALDRGMERHGPLPTLQSRAVDLECARGALDAAIDRIDRAIETYGLSPAWSKRKAEILAAAGRSEQACRVYGEALAQIDALPGHRRTVRAFRVLRAEIEVALARIRPANHARTP